MDFKAFNQAIREVCHRFIATDRDADPRPFVCAILHNAALVAQQKKCDRDAFIQLAGQVWDQMAGGAAEPSPIILPGRGWKH